MTNSRFDALFDGPAREPESDITRREMDLARSIQEVTEEIVLRIARHAASTTGPAQRLPGRRRGAQLRGQRAPAARGAVRADLGPARRRRRRRGGRRGAATAGTRSPTSRACRRRRRRRHERRLPRARSSPTTRSGATCAPTATRRERIDDRGALGRADRRAGGRRQGGGPVHRPDGVRPARARPPLDHRRPPLAHDAVDDEPEDQVPRVVPPVRAGGAGRARRGVLRHRRRVALHDARGPRQRAPARPATAIRHADDLREWVNEVRSEHPRGHPRGLLGPAADRRPRAEPRVPRHPQRLRRADRLPGDDQHLLQRARRADRLHARGRLPLLHAHRDGPPGAGRPPARQGRPAGVDRGASAGARTTCSTDGGRTSGPAPPDQHRRSRGADRPRLPRHAADLRRRLPVLPRRGQLRELRLARQPLAQGHLGLADDRARAILHLARHPARQARRQPAHARCEPCR